MGTGTSVLPVVNLQRVFDGSGYLVGEPGATTPAFIPLLAGQTGVSHNPLHLDTITVCTVGELVQDRPVGGALRVVVWSPVAVVDLTPLRALTLAEQHL